MQATSPSSVPRFARLDSRLIYILVAAALAMPMVFDVKLPPAPMAAADAFFSAVDKLEPKPGKIVLVAIDWGPGTQAENRPQTMVALEHLLRKRIPFAVITIYAQASRELKELPLEIVAQLEKDVPGERWEYGKDWVNLGYLPAGLISIQGMAKAADLVQLLKTDANGAPLGDLPVMAGVKTIRDIPLFMEFTGLVGVFNWWLQFFQAEGYRPAFVHGCTSITIPEAYIYYASKQVVGFHEGVAGAAWYDKRLDEAYVGRTSETAIRVNSGLAFAQLVILAFIAIGNIGYIVSRSREAGTRR